MLSSIHPLGERTRSNRWAWTASYYLIGGLLGGSTIGFISGSIGWLGLQWWTQTPASTAAAVAAVLVTLVVWDVFHLRFPSNQRQVNEDWLTLYRNWVYGGGFGYQLGLGVVTIITTPATYATIALAVLSSDPITGTIVGATFGLVRAVPILTVRRVLSGEDLRIYHRRMQALAPRSAWLVRFSALAASAVVFGVSL